MKESTFKIKNDIGVSIEYTEIGKIKLDREYMLYTDFVPEDNNVGFRIFVAIIKDNKLVEIKNKKLRETIIREFNNQILRLNNG